MLIDWSIVQKEHVSQACALYDGGDQPIKPARNTFLIRDGKTYPAKFIRGLSYQFATGTKLDPSIDYSGGEETLRFFVRLGFTVEYKGEIYDEMGKAVRVDRTAEPKNPPEIHLDTEPSPVLEMPVNEVPPSLQEFEAGDEKTIELIASLITEIQTGYQAWAEQFGSHSQVIVWLIDNGIKTDRCRKQPSFNLFSSDWNSITAKVLKRICPKVLLNLTSSAVNLLEGKSERQRNLIWYLLYFLHPVRHEVFYFEEHFFSKRYHGYFERMAWLIRSHRLGLKSLHTYVSAGDRSVGSPFTIACATTAFKHLHLHPTTIMWNAPPAKDLTVSTKSMDFSGEGISPEEQSVALALCTLVRKDSKSLVDKWLEYAPCAINERPVFTIKAGKSYTDCFQEIIDCLRHPAPTQDLLREKLEECFQITV